MNLTLDANIWVGAFDPSDLRQSVYKNVLKVVFSNPDITVFSPYLMEVEVLASMARKFRDIGKVNDVKNMMWSHPRQYWFVLDNGLAAEASHCATSLYLRGSDAVYVAVAQSNNASLLTFDNEIVTRASSVVPVIKPDQWLKTRAQPL